MTPEMVRLLLIDDDPHDRRRIRQTLETAFPGIEIEHAGDPAALVRAVESPFDVVLLESQLLWIDGLSLFRALRRRHPGMPVIMVTSKGDAELCARVMRAGIFDYVVKKPSGYARLPRAVAHALRRARARRRRLEARAIAGGA